MTLDPDISNCIKRCLIDECKALQVIIFGSYADGRATVDSDVDILAVVGDDQSVGQDATVNARIAIRKALRAIGKEMAFDLVLSKQSEFEKARLLNGTIEYAADQKGLAL